MILLTSFNVKVLDDLVRLYSNLSYKTQEDLPPTSSWVNLLPTIRHKLLMLANAACSVPMMQTAKATHLCAASLCRPLTRPLH